MTYSPGLQVLYEDKCLIAVSKPSGMLSIQDGYQPDLPHVRQILEAQFGHLWIVHRLDRETSGIMLLARRAAAHQHLSLQFEKHAVQKTYLAIIRGAPGWQSKDVNLPLRSSVGRRKRTIVDQKNGKPARSILEVLGHSQEYSLIQAKPSTGRTHQIRAHLYALGYPILGDGLYGDKSNNPPGYAGRLSLHALSLKFRHPETEEVITLAAATAQDFLETARICSLTLPDFALISGKI